MSDSFTRALRPFANKIKSMLGKAILSAISDSSNMQIVKIEGMDGDVFTDVERLQEYGLSSIPPAGAEVIYAALNGNRDHIVVLTTGYSKDRPKGSTGDTFVWSIHKNKISLTKDGLKIEDQFGNTIDMIDGQININGESKSFVTHAELNTALQTFIAALNTHTHGSLGPGTPSAPVPTTQPLVPLTLDISASQTTTVKTGG